MRARKRAGALETQLQDALDAKAALEADIKLLQALPAQIRDMEVLCARKDRELSLSQVLADCISHHPASVLLCSSGFGSASAGGTQDAECSNTLRGVYGGPTARFKSSSPSDPLLL